MFFSTEFAYSYEYLHYKREKVYELLTWVIKIRGSKNIGCQITIYLLHSQNINDKMKFSVKLNLSECLAHQARLIHSSLNQKQRKL